MRDATCGFVEESRRLFACARGRVRGACVCVRCVVRARESARALSFSLSLRPTSFSRDERNIDGVPP